MQQNNKKHLVIINGWGDFKLIWQPFLSRIKAHFNIIFFNLNDLYGKRSAEIFSEEIYILGWSLGAQLAIQLAHHNKNVKKLITIAYNPKFIADEDWPGMDLKIFNAFYEKVNNNLNKGLQYFLKLTLFGENNFRQYLKKICATSHFDNSHGEALQQLTLLKKNDLRQIEERLNIPSLHIYGSNDCLVPVTISEHLNINVENLKIIKEAGHAPFCSQPDLCIEFINEFIYGQKQNCSSI